MNNYYRVQDFIGSSPMIIKSSVTLNQLLNNVLTLTDHVQNKFQIFYNWRQIIKEEQGSLTLKEIVQKDPIQRPIFYICDDVTEEEINHEYKQLYKQLKQHLYVDEKQKKSYWYGSNGHLILDNRNLGLLASSIKHTTDNPSMKKQFGYNSQDTHKQLTESLILEQPQQNSEIKQGQKIESVPEQPGILKRLLMKIGIIKQKPTPQNMKKTLDNLKQVKKQEDLKANSDMQYSDFDPKFVTFLEEVYLKYAIKSAFKLHYVQYKSWDFGVIKKKIPMNAKIGLIGDYGTGLKDSIELLQHMILVNKVDIIIHLGDVYYAGTPQQYQNNILKPLNKLRTQVKREIIFYSIPGNHDYYSWGLPYLCFLKQVNEDVFVRQQASYFCLRSQNDQWQFLGMDTAYYDSDPMDQLSVTGLGPHIRSKQLSWHREKLQNFPGSTIILSHHQLFSIHDRICGSLSSYRNFSCINPLLSSQLFQYMPYFSCWYWGHQHSFMLFADDVLGTPKCRLLGNSSFHVIYQKQHPYERKQKFPYIPFILPDQQYLSKYVPVNPNKKQLYFNLCYGLIDMNKATQDKLPIQYYCCPTFSQATKSEKHFQPYILYAEDIDSIHTIRKKHRPIVNSSKAYIKMQTGLFYDYDQGALAKQQVNKENINYQSNTIIFSLIGKRFIIEVQDRQQLFDEGHISIKTQKQLYYLTLANSTNKLYLTPVKTEFSIWTVKKTYILHDKDQTIKYKNTFKLVNKKKQIFMCCKLNEGVLAEKGTIQHAIFMFMEQNNIKSR